MHDTADPEFDSQGEGEKNLSVRHSLRQLTSHPCFSFLQKTLCIDDDLRSKLFTVINRILNRAISI